MKKKHKPSVKKQAIQKAEPKLLPGPSFDTRELAKIMDGDMELAIFFMSWLRKGMNATAAYEELHPDVTHGSAMVLGHRWLSRVNLQDIMEAYGLGHESYFQQMFEGLRANKNAVLRKYDRKTGELIQELDLSGPDHKTRRYYHEAQGKILGIEKDKQEAPPVNVNIGVAITQASKDRGLEP